MKRLIFFLFFFTLSAPCALADWQNAKWGMSLQQVEAATGLSLTEKRDGFYFPDNPVQFGGHEFLIYFKFTNGELKNVGFNRNGPGSSNVCEELAAQNDAQLVLLGANEYEPGKTANFWKDGEDEVFFNIESLDGNENCTIIYAKSNQ